MKTYTNLNTLTEIAQAMDAGKVVEFYHSIKLEWVPAINIARNTEYRTVEETELPEPGDEILVWDNDEENAPKKYFVTFWADKIYAADVEGSVSYPWNHWKPIDKKPVPREGWVWPDLIHVCDKYNISGRMVHVREVLEDE